MHNVWVTSDIWQSCVNKLQCNKYVDSKRKWKIMPQHLCTQTYGHTKAVFLNLCETAAR